jgi:PAS domain S-box-containing protein/putative nucleotidyltransferase with HDIG domain
MTTEPLVAGDGQLSFTVITDESGGVTQCVDTFSAIVNNRDAEKTIQHLTQLYATLSHSNQALVHCVNEAELFQTICRDVVQSGGMTMSWIGLLDKASQRVNPIASYGDGLAYLDGIEISLNDDEPAGGGPVGSAIREGRPFWIQDFQNDPLTAPWHESGVRFGWGAQASLPLYRNGVAVGAFTLYSTEVNAFDEATRKLLIEIATDISFALDLFVHEAEHKLTGDMLRKSEELYCQIIQTSMDGFWVCDTKGRIMDVNDAYCQLIGYGREELLNMCIQDVEAKESPEETAQHLQEIMTKGHARFETIHRRKDGNLLTVEISGVYRSSEEGGYFSCFLRDITESRQVKKQLLESEARYKRIADGLTDYQFTVHVENGRAVNTLHSKGCATVTGYTPEDFATDPYLWIQIVAPEDRDRIREHVRQILAGNNINPVEYRIIRKDGKTRWVCDTTILFKDASGSLQSYDGVIKDITERKTAEAQAQHYITQLESAFMRTVGVATTLIEMRDPYTAGHERRVADLAAAIGRELGWDARRVEGLWVAGQLHDIGKISTPAEILAKPGEITAAEFMLIKEHSKAGYDALKDIEFPWPVAEVAYQHHERMDGSGYPRGLKGDDILLEARIMSVADVVEAMASHRPYRPGHGINKALAEIERGSGSVYDTTVAGACLRLFRKKGYVLPS